MKIHNSQIDQLLSGIPNDNEDKRYYVGKIKRYSNECGCSWGATFMIISAVILFACLFFFPGLKSEKFLTTGLAGIAFIFGAGIIGKLTGIIIAKVKLFLLYRMLKNKSNITP